MIGYRKDACVHAYDLFFRTAALLVTRVERKYRWGPRRHFCSTTLARSFRRFVPFGKRIEKRARSKEHVLARTYVHTCTYVRTSLYVGQLKRSVGIKRADWKLARIRREWTIWTVFTTNGESCDRLTGQVDPDSTRSIDGWTERNNGQWWLRCGFFCIYEILPNMYKNARNTENTLSVLHFFFSSFYYI